MIITHIGPDPDTIGSALGLKWVFEKLNKTAYIVCSDKANDRTCGFFDILPEFDLAYIKSIGFAPDYIFCVDAAAENQIGRYAEYCSEDIALNKIDIVIDHHYTNSLYGKENYIDEKAAATGEIIYNLAKELNLEIDQAFAKYIYCAIISDSGSFRYSSTTSHTMTAAAELIATGFDFAKLNRLIYQNKSMTQIAIECLAYNSLKLVCGGKIAFITITLGMKKDAGLDVIDLDGINEIAKVVMGVEVGVVIKETEPEENSDDSSPNKRAFKISLRSNDYVNVAEIAACYGGGGHIRAAGCKVDMDSENAVELLEQSLVEKIEKAL
ncbi:MAG: bifunctional oligoribonuclease/PAP phosphatase NrnA [Oscillospiraceae bacterium]|nr:bifunctional oligoribonuclease/PAP phosphatase NrnA [Oscillospiraceae bacterium]